MLRNLGYLICLTNKYILSFKYKKDSYQFIHL